MKMIIKNIEFFEKKCFFFAEILAAEVFFEVLFGPNRAKREVFF